MLFLLCSLLLFVGGGFCALLAGRGKNACLLGAASAVSAAVIGLVPAVQMLATAVWSTPDVLVWDLGPLPIGRALLQLDTLSAFFIIPILLLAALCAVYGVGYLTRLHEQAPGRYHLGAQWLFFNLLAAGLLLLLIAADAFLFLLAWEVMSLAPFFLVSLHNEELAVRTASWVYLVAAHLGALCLLALFGLLASRSGTSLAFADFAALKGLGGGAAMFWLALLGFGTKSGLMPMHVWLPEAYSAAPSHAAAFMSGAAINAGIYGLLRCLDFMGPPQLWWAYLLIGLGALSAVLGILLALVQNDIKRSLAYSSVENMGIVHLAAGFGLYAALNGNPILAVFCFAASLLHLFNHSFYKALLFLAAGSVQGRAGTTLLDRLGGLQKKMPLVGCCFVLGAASIAALPPFNGFAGEFLLYISLASGGAQGDFAGLLYWTGVVVLSAVGGLTLLCFTRLYGLAFLGEARSKAAQLSRPAEWLERLPQLLLCLFCLLAALAAPWLAVLIISAVVPLLGLGLDSLPVFSSLPALADLAPAKLLLSVNKVFAFFLLLVFGLFWLRRLLLRGRPLATSPTWDCGYVAPTSRMQYGAASFAQPMAYFMRSMLRGQVRLPQLREYFPSGAHAEAHFPDRIRESVFRPLFLICLGLANWCKRMQHGRVNGYILYMLLVLVLLLAWKVGNLW